MHTRYQSICGKYGSVPMLGSVALIALFAGTLSFYWLIGFYFVGLIAASYVEAAITGYLRQKCYGIRRGSQLLRCLQMTCVIVGLLIGSSVEYQLPRQTQHDFHILHSGARSAFAEIIKASL